jgi:adenosylcobinamide-GDP ribazoletransferase
LLTSLPLPLAPKEAAASLGRAAAFFPLVGLVMGGILAGAGWLLAWLVPPTVAAGLTLTLWVALTGMLHLDGFMDSCDGLLPPRDPARRLEIMKDSRVGAFGVVGGVLQLLLKFNALTALPAGYAGLAALAVTPVLGRWAMVWVMARYPLARSGGMGVMFTQGLGRPQLVVASVAAGGAALIFTGWFTALVLAAAAWLTAALVARLAMARIHGLTGDVYGATCETVEVVLLIMLAAVSY